MRKDLVKIVANKSCMIIALKIIPKIFYLKSTKLKKKML